MFENFKFFFLFDDVVVVCEKFCVKGKSVVLMNGVFDLLYMGYFYYFQKVWVFGDVLFIVFNFDVSVCEFKGFLWLVQNEIEWVYVLVVMWFIDGIIVFCEKWLMNEILVLKLDVYLKVGDYMFDKFDLGECWVLESVGVKIDFMFFLLGFSIMVLIVKIKVVGDI